MKKLLVVLLIVLAVVAGGVAYADGRIKELVEAHAAAEIAQALPRAEGVEVTLDGFPFTLGVLMRGEVEALHVRIDAVEEQGLRATDLHLDVDAIELDEAALLEEQRLVITGIGGATVAGTVSDDAVSRAVNHEVTFEAGKARAQYQGRVVEVHASIKGRLVLLASNHPQLPPMVFPLPSSDVLPCRPGLELRPGEMRLWCSVDEIPPRLREAMARP